MTSGSAAPARATMRATPKAEHAASAAKRRMRILPPASAAAGAFVVVGLRTHDLARDRTIAERGRHEQRMDAGAACDNHAHVLRPVGDADMVGIADLGEPARAAMFQAVDGALDEARERNARAFEHRLPDLRLADAVARERAGMLGAEHEQRPGREDDVVVAE